MSSILRERRATVIGCAMWVGGLLWLATSWLAAGRAEDVARQAGGAERMAQTELRQLERDAPLIRAAHSHLGAFEASPLLGAASRVFWAERTRAAAARSGVDELRFEIQPGRRVGALDADARNAVYVYTMRLEGRLRHEGMLLTLLSQLSAHEPGRLHPARCQLERLREDRPGPVAMQCDLDWLSIQRAAPAANPR